MAYSAYFSATLASKPVFGMTGAPTRENENVGSIVDRVVLLVAIVVSPDHKYQHPSPAVPGRFGPNLK
jgi:hypothetical protein